MNNTDVGPQITKSSRRPWRSSLWVQLALRVILPVAVGIALFSIAVFAFILPAHQDNLMNNRKQAARKLTQTVMTTLERYEHRANLGELSVADAQSRVLAHIRSLRYGDDLRDYFWVSDLNARMVMHPYRSDLEGLDLSDYRDVNGKKLFSVMSDVARTQGGGFVDYTWQRQNDQDQLAPKVSYVQLFEPWGWIVGTGIYVDDASADLAKLTRHTGYIAIAVLSIVTMLSAFVTWQSYRLERLRRAAEQGLRERDRGVATLMSNLPGMVYRCRNDRDWTFDFVSDACEPLTGYAPDALIGNRAISYAEIIHEEDRELVWQQVQMALKVREPFILTYRIRTADGQVRWVRERGRGVFEDESLIALEGFIYDVTALHKAEEERGLLQTALHQSQKMEAVGQLSAGVAHDFNNLLTVIIGSVENARELIPDDSPALKHLTAIENAGDQATSMTRALLTFSHKIPAQRSTQRLCEALQRGEKLLARLMPATIQLDVQMETENPLWVLADASQLQQVLINLAINARDAMPNGGSLTISVREATEAEASSLESNDPTVIGAATISVEDTGIGIPLDIQQRIFEPFFTTKPRGQATGLGLAIVHGIIRHHHGQIQLKSVVGEGTSFTITLPCVAEPNPQRDVKPIEQHTASEGETILIGEDHQQARELMVTRLRSLEYRVLECPDGDAVIDTYRARQSDIVLYVLDVDMPGLSGLECLEQIRLDDPDVPVVIISGSSEEHASVSNDTATTLLQKPFTMLEFGRHIGERIQAAKNAKRPHESPN